MNKRVALFFGSFNPIHIGHLALANYIAEFSDVDEIRFVVSPQNPFKRNATLLDDHIRLELVRSAIKGYPKFEVSDIEFGMSKPSYTYQTLDLLSKNEPGNEFTLIMGGDNLENFRQWKNHEWILDKYHILVYPRLGYSTEIPQGWRHLSVINAPILEISSTFIRESINNGKDVRFFLPSSVYTEIRDKQIKF
ncbi:MAG: nicotinate (nicotinamide) nucleotide adenylyltransferase [Paludibacteraceae bacterium]